MKAILTALIIFVSVFAASRTLANHYYASPVVTTRAGAYVAGLQKAVEVCSTRQCTHVTVEVSQ
jgi:hypothetical protein